MLKYWMGHADKDMSDLYDRVRDDPRFWCAEAKTMGVGFGVPKKLKAETSPTKLWYVV